MNEQERAELDRLKDHQARLQSELALLSSQLRVLEQHLSQPEEPGPAVSPVTTATTPKAIPPVHATERQKSAETSVPKPPQTTPPPLPPIIPKVHPVSPPNPQLPPVVPPLPAPLKPIELPKTGSSRTDRSLEMRLGTYWAPRVGIVAVLTALVFFANLAYQTYISRLGPAGKITLLYFASALLLGAGWWWQRKMAKPNLRSYAQVLFAGGLAALYFTTYAAHHIERLQVIQSAWVDGLLLMLCAGFMVWIADRKKSEVLALFAVGLAYYTSIITRVGSFTLYSNLVLTLAAVFFLVRNRWTALTFGSLLASYAAYGFWRFFDGNSWQWASPAEGLWAGTYFLISYWIVFTAGVFLSKHKNFAGQNRAGFLTMNNGAFFIMFLLTMMQVQQGGFWRFSLVYGGVLLGLALFADKALTGEPLAKNSYLTQGLLLVTVGLISKFSGLQLSLILGAESVVLLIAGNQRKNVILQVGAYVTAILAVGWGMDDMKQFDRSGLSLGVGLGALMVVNSFVAHRSTHAAKDKMLRPEPAFFTVLALLIWLIATWDNAPREQFPLVLGAEALAITFSIYLLRIDELALLGQIYLVLAQLAWVFNRLDTTTVPPWWNPALLIAFSLGLSHWWPRQRILLAGSQAAVLCQGLYALGIVGVLYFWLSPQVGPPAWLALSGALALGLTLYAVATRAWLLAAAGQLFALVSALQFAGQLYEGKPGWQFPLAPIAVLAVLSFGTVLWFKYKPNSESRISEPLLQIAVVYRWVALVMSISWICEYIPARERIWVLALLGLAVFLGTGWKRNQEALFFSAAFTLSALVLFWVPLVETGTVYWPNLIAILALLAQRQVARQLPQRYPLQPPVHNSAIVIGGLSLWLFVSRWVLEQASGFYLTASWSLLALGFFTTGMVLRERIYRWLGLGVLACALGRVIIFDVWKLETIYRILSFMALGVVLLVLGFVYTKYQEKIKEWL